MIGSSAPSTAAAAVASGPCGSARELVDRRCADADRLTEAAAEHQQRLRDARLQLSEIVRQRERAAEVRDRRSLNDAKEEARLDYREALMRATSSTEIEVAAAQWLSEIHRLNRQVRDSDRGSDDVVRHATEIEGALPGIELAADAARIAAEAARTACLEARRELATCEEDAQRRVAVTDRRRTNRAPSYVAATAVTPTAETDTPVAHNAGMDDEQTYLVAMLNGDRNVLLGLALRLAEDTGLEAGRLQLLLVELREAVASRALEDHAVRFPEEHPFWGQFEPGDAIRIVESLAALGYRFDGQGGWADGHAPSARDLALALSHCDLDPRALRRPAGQAAIDDLWQGAELLIVDHLLACAPDLTVDQVNACLGPRAARLGDLWDNWGRIRPVLMAH